VRRLLDKSTFDAAIDRMIHLYEGGHRIVVSFSGGKDSTASLEVCLAAAAETGNLPVQVVMRDEEIMFPGTFEYAERVARRPDVDFHWVIANQPCVNVFNRREPLFWCFDKLLDPDDWVRRPPTGLPREPYQIKEMHIAALTAVHKFPPAEGRDLFCVTGLRAAESPNRIRGIHSSGGYTTKLNRYGFRYARPIYDWGDGDVWKAIGENGWDYCKAYDVMTRMGVARRLQRIAPPTQRAAQLPVLKLAAAYDPEWFGRVCERLPGVRTAVQFGRVGLEPRRNINESWSECYQRECIDDAPDWIAERCERARVDILDKHKRHSSQPFPEARQCVRCGVIGSWMRMAKDLYLGDPFGFVWPDLGAVEPEFFRPGAGRWEGRPTW